MTLAAFLVLCVIAGVCGSLGAGLGGYSHAGCLTSVLLGFIGAACGLWIAHQFALPAIFAISISGYAFPVVWSVVGAAIFVAIVGLFRRTA